MSVAYAYPADEFSEFLVRARARALTDPVWFAQEILQLKALPGEATLKTDPQNSWEMDLWQIELLESVGDVIRKQKGLPRRVNMEGLPWITVRAMHGPGKTFGMATLMHWFGFCFDSKIPCTAPKLQQLKTRLWPEFRKIRNRAISGYRNLMEVTGGSVHWIDRDGKYSEGPWAFMETASTPENLSGLHYRYIMVLVDEATGVPESLWPVIESAVSTGAIAILVIISNPSRITGTFADSHLKPRVSKNYYKIHIKLTDTSRVPKSWVQKMIDKYGKNSPVVRVRCMGEFAEEDENQLISMEWIEYARNREFEEDGSFPRRRLAVDAADGGSAFSVITYGERYDSFSHMIKQKQYSFESGKSIDLLEDEIERWWIDFKFDARNGDDIVVDSLGVGAGLCSGLLKKGYPVVRYVGGERADNKLYRDRRSQSSIALRDEYRMGRIIVADNFVEDDEWDDWIGQLTSLRRKVGNSAERVEDITTKKELKDQHGPESNFDRVDSEIMFHANVLPMTAAGVSSVSEILGTYAETTRYDAGLA